MDVNTLGLPLAPAVDRERFQGADRSGDLVVIPAGERHGHGATATTEMNHLAVLTEGRDAL